MFGQGEGRSSYFHFNMFKPFIGFHGQQNRYTGQMLTLGVYRDLCTVAPAQLPLGFNSFDEPNVDEVKGESQESSITWENGKGSIFDLEWREELD